MKRTAHLLQTLRANAHSIAALLSMGAGLYMTLAGAACGDHNLIIALLLFLTGICLLVWGFGQSDKAMAADEPFVRWIEEELEREDTTIND